MQLNVNPSVKRSSVQDIAKNVSLPRPNPRAIDQAMAGSKNAAFFDGHAGDLTRAGHLEPLAAAEFLLLRVNMARHMPCFVAARSIYQPAYRPIFPASICTHVWGTTLLSFLKCLGHTQSSPSEALGCLVISVTPYEAQKPCRST